MLDQASGRRPRGIVAIRYHGNETLRNKKSIYLVESGSCATTIQKLRCSAYVNSPYGFVLVYFWLSRYNFINTLRMQ